MRKIIYLTGILALAAALTASASGCGNAETKFENTVPVSEITNEEQTEIFAENKANIESDEKEEPADEEESDARAEEVFVTTDNEGEENQHVNFTVNFDSELGTIKAEDFSVTVAGNEAENERISVKAEGRSLVLTIRTDAIKAGMIEVDYSGKGAHGFFLHSIVSPGMHLELISQDEGKAEATVRVSELYHIRGIGRVMLLENDEIVETQGENPSVFTGVHGHNFLELDENTIAEKIVFGLGESFPEGYEFSNDGATVTVKKLNAQGPVKLLLKVQEKLEIELK